MRHINHYKTADDVARAAAEHAVATLNDALARNGTATWVLAGGSSPLDAYTVLARDYADTVDWSRVTALIGDERNVPISDQDSNWGKIAPILFADGPTAQMRQLAPPIGKFAEDTAAAYAVTVQQVLDAGRFDLVWLGVGDDGHTLSLAPGRADLFESDELLVPVHDFPKPPADRISFTLRALAYADHAVVFAAGDAKKDVLARALNGEDLPVTLADRAVTDAGGTTTWLFDAASSPQNS